MTRPFTIKAAPKAASLVERVFMFVSCNLWLSSIRTDSKARPVPDEGCGKWLFQRLILVTRWRSVTADSVRGQIGQIFWASGIGEPLGGYQKGQNHGLFWWIAPEQCSRANKKKGPVLGRILNENPEGESKSRL